MGLLLIIDENKSRYLYIKNFDRFMFQKTKSKNKKYFCKRFLQCFSSKNVLAEHKKVCLSINGTQTVKLGKGKIEFKNAFKEIQVPFKTYSDFESVLTSAESNEGFYSKKKNIKITFFVVLLINLFLLMIDLVNQLLLTEVEILLINLLKQFLKSMNTVKK